MGRPLPAEIRFIGKEDVDPRLVAQTCADHRFENVGHLADLGIQPGAVEALVPAYLARFQPGGARRVR